MPTFNFLNKKTGKVFTTGIMTIAEVEKYAKDNPGYEWLCSAPGVGDSWRLGRVKPPEVFRDRLREIKKNVPGADFDSSFS